ncbi:Replication factor A protein 1 [Entamoeba marina]
MSVTHYAPINLILNEQVVFPLFAQVKFSKNKPLDLNVEAKVSDCLHSITLIIKCNKIEEVRAIKPFISIKVTEGYMYENSNSSVVLLCVNKFKVVSNSVNNQLCPNTKELEKKNQFIPYHQIDLSERKITPLDMLTEGNKARVIEVVVAHKSGQLKFFKNDVKINYFVFISQDKDGNEIECKCFGEIFNKYFDFIEENITYRISRGYLQPPKGYIFRSDRMIDLECIINPDSIIQKSKNPIQRQSNIKPIKELEECAVDGLYSIRGDINSIGKTYGDKPKRVVEVVDESDHMIGIKLFNDSTHIAEALEVGKKVQFDNLQLKEYNSKKIMHYTKLSRYVILSSSDEENIITQSLVENNESTNIQNCSDSITSPNPTMSLKELEENARNANGKPVEADVNVKICAFRTDTISYFVCDGCEEKVDNDVIICTHCNNKNCTPEPRYDLKLVMKNSGYFTTGTMFNKVATEFLGMPAEKLMALKESNFVDYENFFKSKEIQVTFGLQGKSDDKGVVRINIFHCQILDGAN